MNYITTDNITELNELIYSGAKLEIKYASLKESKEKLKSWMGNEDRRTNKEAATTSETGVEDKTHRNPTKCKDPKKTTADKTDNTT